MTQEHDPAAPLASPNASVNATLNAAVAFLLLFFVPTLFKVALVALGFRSEAVQGLESGAVHKMFGLTLLCLLPVLRHEGLAWRLQGNALRTLATFAGFMVLWIPVSLVAYPWLVHKTGYTMPPQDLLVYLAGPVQPWALVVFVSLACVLAPIGEELFFRGYIYRLVAVRTGEGTAVVITSVVFGIIHGAMYALPLTLMGFLFGYLRWRTGGLAAPILAHMLNNTLTVGCVLFWPGYLELVFDPATP